MTLNRICQWILVKGLATFSLKASLCVSFSPFYHSFHNIHGKPCLWEHAGDSYSCLTYPTAALTGHVPDDERSNWEQALQDAGFSILPVESLNLPDCEYAFSRATGMLQLLRTQNEKMYVTQHPLWQQPPPRWIPVVRNMENILVANGWSFLDPDESEALSAFDIDAANREGQYKPKWGTVIEYNQDWGVSQIGFVLQPLSEQEIDMEVSKVKNHLSLKVLLEGGTDPPHQKETQNGYRFAGSVQDIPPGIFVCAIGGLPLFTTQHLSPSTASSGWLSFSRPISDDHIIKIFPQSPNDPDPRIEVICAKSRCHLGHYFGLSEGYCINASTLNFLPTATSSSQTSTNEATIARDIDSISISSPYSWRSLEKDVTISWIAKFYKSITYTETLWLGAGCFWHVEAALRRLPGVISTTVGYTGGTTLNPTYEDISQSETAHVEVVQIIFDPFVLKLRVLLDCFLAMHDPTTVRAHGKHARGTGQYRSCIILKQERTITSRMDLAQDALNECQKQLGKAISTEISYLSQFWPAEERHQRHDERRNPEKSTSTLEVLEWIQEYGKRRSSIVGSATTLSNFLSR
jgi:peptide-methionine (S)-S-oxide reductase